MVTFKYRWMTAFGTSLVCHAAAIILISGIAFLFPPVVVNKGPIEVDLVSGGGGGGGGGSPDGTGEGVPQINPPTAKPTETLPAPADEEVDEDAVNDVHEISDTSSQEYKDVTSSQSANVGEGNTAGQDGSSNRG